MNDSFSASGAANGAFIASRPLIGISCYLEQARFGVWDMPAALLHKPYVDSVVAAGGTPVLIPPGGAWDASLVSRLDGLVLAGGADIDPAHYGQPALPTTGAPRRDRDGVEFQLLDAARESGVPVLGVCRGLQVINIALGGDLRQHLPDDVGSTDHLPRPGTFGRVEVKVAAESRLAGILGEQATVSCHHHQGAGRLGAGLVPVAWAADGSVEALELPGDNEFLLGVQWHPEMDADGVRLFEALVEAA
ncbi:MAG TPA: gamma-glutamyl-gamma-aminobutyrate hydrolase family protein [Actinophytocola sp.]|uniref:gamma-glutamyl-gamma-aminobutyrate hydrolase family protein n=1 Tax=Actinophytocola sp. TaxID=1872138 RepID=UPI002E0307A4|nr:gamma-glutamyl-gamma-aminobutyrate hydrolase family protein [Actinophytocola sp.]